MIIQLSCCWSEFEVGFWGSNLEILSTRAEQAERKLKSYISLQTKKASKSERASRLRDYEIIFLLIYYNKSALYFFKLSKALVLTLI